VALIRTDVSEDRIASIFRVKVPHGVISQKMIIIIVTAVETSNLTRHLSYLHIVMWDFVVDKVALG
jgi:hypothetical protein